MSLDPTGRDVPPRSRWRHRSTGELVTVLHLLGARGGGFEVVFRPDGMDVHTARSQGRTAFMRSHRREPGT